MKRIKDSLTPDEVDALLKAVPPGAVVYLVGVGGCGVSGLGHLLLDLGFQVTGSDLVANDETRQLTARGAQIECGHSAEFVRAARPILLGYSSAVRPDNPEIRAALELGVPVVRRAVLLAALVHRQRAICVAGMHGKTTTSAWLAFALRSLGAQPSWAVGALVPQLPCHAGFALPSPAAAAPLFVLETDESDGTQGLFRPEHGILLNVDAEHLDYYSGLESVCREFGAFAACIRRLKIYCKDDSNLDRFLAGQPGAVSFGFHAEADYRLEIGPAAAAPAPPATSPAQTFRVWHEGQKLGDFTIALLGQKNLSNAGAVIALLHQLGHGPADIARAIAPFRGAARRQELLHADARLRVYDDYGHHPNEIRATLAAFRALRPGRLVVVFQPHRFTRTRHLLHDFAAAFAEADALWLTDIYAASEPAIPGVSSAVLAEAIRARGQAVEYVPRLSDLGPAVLRAARAGDLILFLGAGDITQVAHGVAAQLKLSGAPAGARAATAGGSPVLRPAGGGVKTNSTLGQQAARAQALLGIESLLGAANA